MNGRLGHAPGAPTTLLVEREKIAAITLGTSFGTSFERELSKSEYLIFLVALFISDFQ